jgi:hypothetical protein
MHKRARYGEVNLEKMPTVILHLIAGFGADTLWTVLELKHVCTTFRQAMSMPGALTHLRVVDLNPKKVDRLGTMAKGIHGLSTHSLDRLPAMPAIRRLELSQCDATSSLFKGALSVLKYLEILNLSFCKHVTALDVLPAHVRIMTIYQCPKLKDLPPEMLHLESLHVANCKLLRVLPRAPSILRVNFSGYAILNDTVRKLQHLRTEYICNDEFANLTALESLRLSNCTFQRGDFLESLTNLQSLTIMFWMHTGLHDLSSVSALRALRGLELENNITDHDLGHLVHLPLLTSLTVVSHMVTDIGIEELAKIKTLTFFSLNNYECDGVTSHSLRALQQLRGLCLTDCDGVEDLGFIKLRHLTVYGCHGIYNLESMDVVDLDIENCESITSLAPINDIHSLAMLRVVGCGNLTREGILELEPRGSVALCEHARTLLDAETIQRWQSSTTELIFEAVE